MNITEATLSKLLKLNDASETDRVQSDLAKQKDRILAEVAVPWEPLREKLVEQIVKMLDLKLLDFCLAVWRKEQELRPFADPKQHPPDEVNHVNLLEHEIVSEHHPTLDISLGGKRIKKLECDLNFTLSIRGCILTIKGGKIIEVAPGECACEAKLNFKDIPLLAAKTKDESLGKSVPLAEPVTIPPP